MQWSWSAPDASVSSYQFQWRYAGDSWASANLQTLTARSAEITAADATKNVEARVKAINSAGTGPWSSTGTVAASALLGPLMYSFTQTGDATDAGASASVFSQRTELIAAAAPTGRRYENFSVVVSGTASAVSLYDTAASPDVFQFQQLNISGFLTAAASYVGTNISVVVGCTLSSSTLAWSYTYRRRVTTSRQVTVQSGLGPSQYHLYFQSPGCASGFSSCGSSPTGVVDDRGTQYRQCCRRILYTTSTQTSTTTRTTTQTSTGNPPTIYSPLIAASRTRLRDVVVNLVISYDDVPV